MNQNDTSNQGDAVYGPSATSTAGANLRYHFGIRDHGGYFADLEGRELPSLDVARAEAVHGIRSLVAADVLNGVLNLNGECTITDETGALLTSVSYAEAVAIQ